MRLKWKPECGSAQPQLLMKIYMCEETSLLSWQTINVMKFIILMKFHHCDEDLPMG